MMPAQHDDPRTLHRNALLQNIPDVDRREFEEIYDQHLQQAIRAARVDANAHGTVEPDPDDVEAAMIQQLIRDADGDPANGVLGNVPMGIGQGDYAFRPPSVAPSSMHNVVRTTTRRRATHGANTGMLALSPQRKALIAGAAVTCIAILIWNFWSGIGPQLASLGDALFPAQTRTENTAQTVTTEVIAALNTSDVEWSDPASLEIEDQADGPQTIFRILPQEGKLGGSWEFSLDAGIMSWLRGTYINYVLCVPPANVDALSRLREGTNMLLRSANGARRKFTMSKRRMVKQYEIEILNQDHAGITLIACGSSGVGRLVVEAISSVDDQEFAAKVAETRTTPFAITPQVLENTARITVESATWVTDTAPLNGYSQVRIPARIENIQQAPLPSAELAAMLLDGERGTGISPLGTLPSDTLSGGAATTTEWRFLVPITLTETALTITAANGSNATWKVLIPPYQSPPLQSLHATLRASALTRNNGTGLQRVRFDMELYNPTLHAIPVSLTEVRLTTSDGRELPLRADANTQVPREVASQATVRISFEADVGSETVVELAYGTQQFVIQIPQ